jgi:NADPH-dependent curcumin reductase CurA
MSARTARVRASSGVGDVADLAGRLCDRAVEGVGNVVDAFIGVLRGASTGKMIVQVGDTEEK